MQLNWCYRKRMVEQKNSTVGLMLHIFQEQKCRKNIIGVEKSYLHFPESIHNVQTAIECKNVASKNVVQHAINNRIHYLSLRG